MRKHSFLRALVFAALLAASLTQTALADTPAQQAMHQSSDATPSVGLTGPYDAPAPTVGD